MSLTRDDFERRKAQLQGDMNAIAGALQDCDYWIAELARRENGYEVGDLIPGATVEEVVPASEVPAWD